MKEFTTKEKGMIKNTAKTVYPLYEKLYKLEEQMQVLATTIESQRNTIDTWEAGVMNLTGGYKSIELCDRELVQVGTNDKGKPINKANFKLKYEDTVLPPEDIANNDTPTATIETPNVETINTIQ